MIAPANTHDLATDTATAGEVDALPAAGGAERRLRPQVYQDILDRMEDGCFVLDRELTYLYVNPAMARRARLTPQAMVGRRLLDLFPEAERTPLFATYQRCLAQRAPQQLESEVTFADGTSAWYAARVEPIPEGIFVLSQDITERRLRESEGLYRSIGESIDYGVWVCAPDGRNTYASDSFLRMVGLTQEQCSNFGWGEVLHPDDAAGTIAAWQECVRTGGRWEREHRFRGVDGQWHHVLARGVPVRNSRGELRCWAGLNLDIGRLKQAEESLRDSDRRKDEFLATLSHELRNPLAPMRNAVQILRLKGSDIPAVQWAREVIDRQVQAMSRLIDDLLDVNRINQGKIQLKREQVDLAQVVRGAVETSRPLIDEMGHELVVTLPPGSVSVDADPTRLTQVLLNLLNNAAKYTGRGGRIDLRASLAGSEVVVSVRDTGIGIPADKLPTLFEMFSQVEGALSRSRGGLGIGLCLAKRLVEMHGGSIEARSGGPGQGSEFVVRLPIVVSRTGEGDVGDDDAGAQPTSMIRVLVVDDNRDAAESLAMLLGEMGGTVYTAYDGEAAVAAAREVRPHAVVCDIGLPKLNGYEACRQMKAQAWDKKMLLIAVTGWGQDDDRRRSEQAGFDCHMVKPVDPQALMTLLAGLDTRQM